MEWQHQNGIQLQTVISSELFANRYELMNICLVQTHPEGRRNNVQYLGWTMSQINADLYVLPELFNTGFDYLAVPQRWPTDAEELPEGLTCRQILGFLRGRSSSVICGLPEKAGSDLQCCSCDRG